MQGPRFSPCPALQMRACPAPAVTPTTAKLQWLSPGCVQVAGIPLEALACSGKGGSKQKHRLLMPGMSFSRHCCLRSLLLPPCLRGGGAAGSGGIPQTEGGQVLPRSRVDVGNARLLLLSPFFLTSPLPLVLQRLANAAEKFQKAHHWQDNIRVRLRGGTGLRDDSWHRNRLLVPSLLPSLGSSSPPRPPSLASYRWPCGAAQHAGGPGTATCQH